MISGGIEEKHRKQMVEYYNGLVHDLFPLFSWKLKVIKNSNLTALFIFLVPLQIENRHYSIWGFYRNKY